jgi:hypothetical protein
MPSFTQKHTARLRRFSRPLINSAEGSEKYWRVKTQQTGRKWSLLQESSRSMAVNLQTMDGRTRYNSATRISCMQAKGQHDRIR